MTQKKMRGSVHTTIIAGLIIFGALAGQGVPVSAQTSDQKTASPSGQSAASASGVNIEADSMEIKENEKQAVFKGNAHLVKGEKTIDAEEIIAYYDDVKQPDGSSKSEVKTLDASQNVKITTAKQVITGNTAHFDLKADKLIVKGNVKLLQGKTEMRGERLDVDMKTDRTVMTGGRVQGSFVPK